jgi:hypothetical protein
MKDAYSEIACIDARVRDKMLKWARKRGMTNQDEIVELVEAWMAHTRDLPTRIVTLDRPLHAQEAEAGREAPAEVLLCAA